MSHTGENVLEGKQKGSVIRQPDNTQAQNQFLHVIIFSRWKEVVFACVREHCSHFIPEQVFSQEKKEASYQCMCSKNFHSPERQLGIIWDEIKFSIEDEIRKCILSQNSLPCSFVRHLRG